MEARNGEYMVSESSVGMGEYVYDTMTSTIKVAEYRTDTTKGQLYFKFSSSPFINPEDSKPCSGTLVIGLGLFEGKYPIDAFKDLYGHVDNKSFQEIYGGINPLDSCGDNFLGNGQIDEINEFLKSVGGFSEENVTYN